jgi:formiminotetrahydrofolate cyclodeaminase
MDAFMERLASADPTPGGGGASACCGALAAALASMVGNLTVGKKRYADVEVEIQETIQTLDQLRKRLIALIDEDACAFEPLAKTYRMPHTTPEEIQVRDSARQHALVEATRVPLAIMDTCARVIDASDVMAHKGSRLALSDAGAAAAIARGALCAASLNVRINAAAMTDRDQADQATAHANQLIAASESHADEIYRYVLEEVQ